MTLKTKIADEIYESGESLLIDEGVDYDVCNNVAEKILVLVTESFPLFNLTAINSDTSTELLSINFKCYVDMSTYIKDAKMWGLQISNKRYKIGNVLMDGANIYLIVREEGSQ